MAPSTHAPSPARRLRAGTGVGLALMAMLLGAEAGELSAADRAGARRALVAQEGRQGAAGYALSDTGSGCRSDTCTSIDTRTALFTRDLQGSGERKLAGEVLCVGYKDTWTCGPQRQVGVFTLDGERQEPVLRGISLEAAIEVARFLRSDCHRAALQARLERGNLPPWAAKLPLSIIDQPSPQRLVVTQGDGGTSLFQHLSPAPSGATCAFTIDAVGASVV